MKTPHPGQLTLLDYNRWVPFVPSPQLPSSSQASTYFPPPGATTIFLLFLPTIWNWTHWPNKVEIFCPKKKVLGPWMEQVADSTWAIPGEG